MISLLKGLFIFAPVITIGTVIDSGERAMIERPAGSYQKIIEWKNHDHYCLMYKVPLPRKKNSLKGELFVVKNKEAGCSLRGERVGGLAAIEKLEIQNINKKKGLNFDLLATISGEEVRIKNDFPFFDKKNNRWRMLYPSVEQRKGLRAQLKRGDICLRRDENCSAEEEESCSQCPHGLWTPYIDLYCSQKISAQCGDYLCGERGQKACVRMVSLGKVQSCKEIRPYVYCQYGLEVECQSNGEVTCR